MAGQTTQLAKDVAAEVGSFGQGGIVTVPVEINRAYHDPSKVDKGKVLITIYPLDKRKQDPAKNLLTEFVACECVITRRIVASDTDGVDHMIDYYEAIDRHLETAKIPNATTMVETESQSIWYPDFLHDQNLFIALVPLLYSWRRSKGP